MRHSKVQYLILTGSSETVLILSYQDTDNYIPILPEASRVVLNQKYWVSLESSHSGMVRLSAVRGQADQGRVVWKYCIIGIQVWWLLAPDLTQVRCDNSLHVLLQWHCIHFKLVIGDTWFADLTHHISMSRSWPVYSKMKIAVTEYRSHGFLIVSTFGVRL